MFEFHDILECLTNGAITVHYIKRSWQSDNIEGFNYFSRKTHCNSKKYHKKKKKKYKQIHEMVSIYTFRQYYGSTIGVCPLEMKNHNRVCFKNCHLFSVESYIFL